MVSCSSYSPRVTNPQNIYKTYYKNDGNTIYESFFRYQTILQSIALYWLTKTVCFILWISVNQRTLYTNDLGLIRLYGWRSHDEIIFAPEWTLQITIPFCLNQEKLSKIFMYIVDDVLFTQHRPSPTGLMLWLQTRFDVSFFYTWCTAFTYILDFRTASEDSYRFQIYVCGFYRSRHKTTSNRVVLVYNGRTK